MARFETALKWQRPVPTEPTPGVCRPQGRARLKVIVSSRPPRRHERKAVHGVLEDHWPLWDTPERIALFARLPLDLTERALEDLRDEGFALRDGDLWRAERTISRL